MSDSTETRLHAIRAQGHLERTGHTLEGEYVPTSEDLVRYIRECC